MVRESRRQLWRADPHGVSRSTRARQVGRRRDHIPAATHLHAHERLSRPARPRSATSKRSAMRVNEGVAEHGARSGGQGTSATERRQRRNKVALAEETWSASRAKVPRGLPPRVRIVLRIDEVERMRARHARGTQRQLRGGTRRCALRAGRTRATPRMPPARPSSSSRTQLHRKDRCSTTAAKSWRSGISAPITRNGSTDSTIGNNVSPYSCLLQRGQPAHLEGRPMNMTTLRSPIRLRSPTLSARTLQPAGSQAHRHQDRHRATPWRARRPRRP